MNKAWTWGYNDTQIRKENPWTPTESVTIKILRTIQTKEEKKKRCNLSVEVVFGERLLGISVFFFTFFISNSIQKLHELLFNLSSNNQYNVWIEFLLSLRIHSIQSNNEESIIAIEWNFTRKIFTIFRAVCIATRKTYYL